MLRVIEKDRGCATTLASFGGGRASRSGLRPFGLRRSDAKGVAGLNRNWQRRRYPPHTKHPAVTRRLGILGLCRTPVDFDSLDAEPVDLIFLILSPSDSPGYQSMRVPREQEQLNRRLLSTEFCDQLRQASSEVGLREILTQPVLSDW